MTILTIIICAIVYLGLGITITGLKARYAITSDKIGRSWDDTECVFIAIFWPIAFIGFAIFYLIKKIRKGE